ncbi:TetR/AcrR family transcriptional regulator [Leucobacter chromiiresistens]|uniref:TetR family transcriptional regulator n=1 Tax=Leucobacter chromiiresistens TaxID=1079994 RepID=A0A147EMQ1_9MICO|nr:TetR/AcrR family transcriptional regulator C-terminal domain-containing protein [Leucobacter chromiiresistens]KTR85576.1 TetR family transcriptional regulator [Leucobacter chromiiresistens]
MARPKTARLSREIIGRAAIELAESGRELQLVPLARELGVSVSSLYHHVDGRDGVIRAMREVLVPQYLADVPQGSGWEERIRLEVERTWRMYAGHPRVLQYMVTAVIDEPDVMRFYNALADALAEAGLPAGELLTTIEVIDAFTFGAALDTLSPDTILDPASAGDVLGGLLADHPVGAERNRRLFDRGLDLLLAGIAARVATATTPPT